MRLIICYCGCGKDNNPYYWSFDYSGDQPLERRSLTAKSREGVRLCL